MPPKKSSVFVVYERDAADEITFAGAYTNQKDADAEAAKLKDGGEGNVAVEEMSLDANAGKKESGKGKATAASKKGKEKSKTPADGGDDDDQEDGQEAAPVKPQKASKKTSAKASDDAKSARKVVPKGEAGSCDGLKLLFTGTMSRDRKVMEATAIKYGAEIVNKLEDTDWIILGTKPGPKKVQQIKEEGLKTMTEDQFIEMVQGGGEPAESAEPAEPAEPPKKKAKA